jgi:phosphopantothenoylcysteine decarboxylase/phosphopantothenate--cysteine ligase
VLLNKRIIVGICGGIASYKAVELVSQLQQAGALVDVIMTEHAENFVRSLTFSSLSHRPVYSDLWEPSGEAAERHIALAEAADVLVIVPATANTIAKLAYGIADNMLAAVALATKAPLLLAPAMYHQMYMHPATQANLALLRARGAVIVEPEVGRLASGAIGPGRLPETPVLMGAISMLLGQHGDLAGRRVVVTAGGTQEPVDPVRYLGNRSSGKMGYALAIEARDRGAHVSLISGPVALPAPYGVEFRKVETAVQMRDAVFAAITDADVLIMSAAVADFRPAAPAAHKMKKESMRSTGQPLQENTAEAREKRENTQEVDRVSQGQQGEPMTFPLLLTHNPDILGELATLFDRQQKSGQVQRRLIRVGFAAETDDVIAHAQSKLTAKQLDLLVANDVSRSDSGFGADTNKVFIFHATGAVEDLPVMPKTDVATIIWDRVVSLLGHA